MRFMWTLPLLPIFALLPMSEYLRGYWGQIWQLTVMAYLGLTYLVFPKSKVPFQGAWRFAFVTAAFGTLTASYNSLDPYRHWFIGAQVLFFLAIGPSALRSVVLNYPQARFIIACSLLAGQTTSALTSMAQGLDLLAVDITTPSGRTPGLAGHPNILGLMSGVTICAVLYLLLRFRDTKAYSD